GSSQSPPIGPRTVPRRRGVRGPRPGADRYFRGFPSGYTASVGRAFPVMQHLRPGIAQLAQQTLHFDHESDVLLDVRLEQPAEVIIVELVEIGGDGTAGLVIERSLEFRDDVLGLLEVA